MSFEADLETDSGESFILWREDGFIAGNAPLRISLSFRFILYGQFFKFGTGIGLALGN